MANEVVKALLIEVDANLEKLRRELRKGEGELGTFATKAKASGKEVAAGADAMTNKFGAAARGAASAFETIARTGKASGEAVKQLVAQGANAAIFFGPYGALVGAIGISTVAIIEMFSNTKRELAELEKRSVSALNAFSQLDAKGMQAQIARLETGDPFKQSLGTIFSESDAAKRREALVARGRGTLGEDIARLMREREDAAAQRMRISMNAAGQSVTGDDVRVAELTAQIKELAAVRKEVSDQLAIMAPLSERAEQQEAALKKVTEESKRATKGATDAEKARADALRELQSESERTAEATKKLILDTMGTSVDRVAARYDEAIAKHKELAAAGVDPAGNMLRADDLEDAKRSAIGAAEALERAATALNAIDMARARGQVPAWMDIDRLGDSAKRLRDELRALIPGTESYVAVREKLLKVEKELNELKTSNDPDAPTPKDPKTEARDMADYAREVQQAADGALQLAQNLSGASESSVSLLRSIIQVAGNLPALGEAWKARDKVKPGESMLGANFGIVSAALPILGALSSMFGKSPEEQQRARELRENTEAIRELTEKAGLLGGPGVSGAANLSGRQGLARFITQYSGSFEATAGLSAGNFARARGVDLGSLRELAASYGVTLNDSIESFRQLQRAIDEASGKLGEFGDDLDSQRRQAEAEISLFGITDPAERLRIRQGATAGRSSALDGVTAGLDLSTAEGREQARRNAQALFEIMRSGGDRLTEAQMGGLTGDELLQALLDLIEGLRDVEGAVSDASGGSVVGGVSGYAGLTAAAGARIEDYNRALVAAARDAQATRLDMLARLDVLVAHLAGPIPVPPLSGMTAGSAAAGLQISIGSIVLHVQAAGGMADDVLDAIGSGLERAASDALYRGVLRARQAAGDLRVVRS